MSYEITFENIPEDILNKYKIRESYNVNEKLTCVKYEIIEACFKYEKKYQSAMSLFVSDLGLLLSRIKLIQIHNANQDFYNGYTTEDKYSPKGSYTICGSVYRQITDDNELESATSYCLDNFVMLGAIAEIPDYNDNSENWIDRYNEISEIVDYYIETCYKYAISKIKQELYEYSDEYKEQYECEEQFVDDVKNIK